MVGAHAQQQPGSSRCQAKPCRRPDSGSSSGTVSVTSGSSSGSDGAGGRNNTSNGGGGPCSSGESTSGGGSSTADAALPPLSAQPDLGQAGLSQSWAELLESALLLGVDAHDLAPLTLTLSPCTSTEWEHRTDPAAACDVPPCDVRWLTAITSDGGSADPDAAGAEDGEAGLPDGSSTLLLASADAHSSTNASATPSVPVNREQRPAAAAAHRAGCSSEGGLVRIDTADLQQAMHEIGQQVRQLEAQLWVQCAGQQQQHHHLHHHQQQQQQQVVKSEHQDVSAPVPIGRVTPESSSQHLAPPASPPPLERKRAQPLSTVQGRPLHAPPPQGTAALAALSVSASSTGCMDYSAGSPTDLSDGSSGDGCDAGVDPWLWVRVNLGEACMATQCSMRHPRTHNATRRHYHATCDHVHASGAKKGMPFHHHQLEKIRKHQRAHAKNLKAALIEPSVDSPFPGGMPPVVAKALLLGNAELHDPHKWSDVTTAQLRGLVDRQHQKRGMGRVDWESVAADLHRLAPVGVGEQLLSPAQCLLHWRVAINGGKMVQGVGTWCEAEDTRLRALSARFGQAWSTISRFMPGRGPKQCRERFNNITPSSRSSAVHRNSGGDGKQPQAVFHCPSAAVAGAAAAPVAREDTGEQGAAAVLGSGAGAKCTRRRCEPAMVADVLQPQATTAPARKRSKTAPPPALGAVPYVSVRDSIVPGLHL